MIMPLPRYVRPRGLAGGQIGFYWIVPTHFRRLGCTIPNEPLGHNYAEACGENGIGGRASALRHIRSGTERQRRWQYRCGRLCNWLRSNRLRDNRDHDGLSHEWS